MNWESNNIGNQHIILKISSDLENMIRPFCFDIEKDWDDGIHLLLFAVRVGWLFWV